MASSSVDKGLHAESKVPQRENPIGDQFNVVSRKIEPLPEYDDFQNAIVGYDATLMRARATLSTEDEKKLLRRIDWHLLPLLAVMYAVKTIDAANVGSLFSLILQSQSLYPHQVSNARIMDQGTPRNIMTELHMTSDQYNLVTAAYYVSKSLVLVQTVTKSYIDTLHSCRNSFQPRTQAY